MIFSCILALLCRMQCRNISRFQITYNKLWSAAWEPFETDYHGNDDILKDFKEKYSFENYDKQDVDGWVYNILFVQIAKDIFEMKDINKKYLLEIFWFTFFSYEINQTPYTTGYTIVANIFYTKWRKKQNKLD